ncbi:ATP-dependent helicase HrpB [Brevibacterium iodinum ATCC 49514]|uniref:ATP-dependent helicase HrpB n=1 Tax=Brevibacterium iodinum ATCC 49514 TaxID=1255616 RepID=A0A2H1IDH1_9MICO|nr:ATP-dependent helicase C-terminal domain-containing protein [Brevibacterium iodinum]SMX73166.1 ATP-dependent helicase HrpB [Brevibacterium iodinum ATCC 49514]SUW13097.1 ATP-dependent RNA helicase HrpB [Brevibacterium iodinum]
MPDPHLPHTFDLARIGAGLPAAALIDELGLAEATPAPRLVVEAPPGTGKTTVVPPMIAEHLTGPGRIIVTQPRRMAARAAARRLASLTGTRLGEVVGFTVRGESRTSRATRIEFVTTGVLLSRLLHDPELTGIDGVILDEVHERQLDTDLAFAMCRELADLREDLSVVVMSATLDAQLWAARLGDGPQAPATLLSVSADPHPLEIRWAPAKERPLDSRGVTWDFLDHLAATTVRALTETGEGDVLVFAPGAREVDEVASRVRRRVESDGGAGASGGPVGAGDSGTGDTIEVHTLTGRTPAKEQDAILRPRTDQGRNRRVIVSTSVAESALTIDGVRIVVDSGLSRGPRLDTRRRMSGLVTMRESKASGTQRSGRAARQGPGVAYRCMSEADWASLPEHTPPEIATSDLTSAVLALAVWGGDETLLPDPLPAGPKRQAVDNLVALGAVEISAAAMDGAGGGRSADGRQTGERPDAAEIPISALHVTQTGRAIAAVPASVWSARGLLDGAALLSPARAAEAVAVIESDQRAPGADLSALLRQLRHRKDTRFAQDCKRFASIAREFASDGDGGDTGDDGGNGGIADRGELTRGSGTALTPEDLGLVTALSYPLQIARLRSASDSEYLLASGTAASLPRDSSLQGSPWMAIAEVGLAGSRAIIRSAVPIDVDTAELAGAGLLHTEEAATFESGKVRAVRRSRLGGIELTSTPIQAGRELARRAIAESVRERGAREVLRPSEAVESLRARLGLLRAIYGDPWPEVTWEHLSDTLDQWCPDALDRIAKGSDPARVDLVSALRGLLPWPEAARLDELVPTHIEVPSGSHIRLEYPDPERAELPSPILAVKLQECFGWTDVPRICDGRVAVTMHLLSPARRPLAVTSDLASFWANAYAHVRAENRGRYPKHPWPEDPLTAPAAKGTKRSGR